MQLFGKININFISVKLLLQATRRLVLAAPHPKLWGENCRIACRRYLLASWGEKGRGDLREAHSRDGSTANPKALVQRI